MICLADLTGKLYNNGRICRLERCGETMYSLKNRAFAGVLALLMLLSMTGCAGTISGEEYSGSTVTQEEYDALKEQNEQLQAELDELKGETDGEAEDGTEPDASGEGEDTSGSSASGSAPADNASSSAPAQTSSAAPVQQTAPAQTSTASGKGPLAKYTVNVTDSSTPAVKVTGTTLNGKSAYYFYSADGKLLGDIPTQYLGTIINENGLSYAEADEQKAWFVENFNIYRGLDGGSYESGSGSTGGSSSSSDIDIEEYRDEVFRLVNEARETEGLEPLVAHSTAMEFAQIRAEEISESFSHKRPDGTVGEYSHYQFMENIAMRQSSSEEVVDAWLNSSGHRAAIMADYSDQGNYMGVGVYEKNGVLYWVLEFIAWDSEG